MAFYRNILPKICQNVCNFRSDLSLLNQYPNHLYIFYNFHLGPFAALLVCTLLVRRQASSTNDVPDLTFNNSTSPNLKSNNCQNQELRVCNVPRNIPIIIQVNEASSCWNKSCIIFLLYIFLLFTSFLLLCRKKSKIHKLLQYYL